MLQSDCMKTESAAYVDILYIERWVASLPCMGMVSDNADGANTIQQQSIYWIGAEQQLLHMSLRFSCEASCDLEHCC